MPSLRMTRPITAAPIQNNRGNAVVTAATPPACRGPRITYCASARMVPGPVYLCLVVVAVRIRQQCQVAGTLDSGSQLTLITCPLPGTAAVYGQPRPLDRKSTRLNSSHVRISYAVFCLK